MMKTVETIQRAGPDGKLRLEIPVEKSGSTYHVVVIVHEQSIDASSVKEWPPGYLDSIIGKWQGDFARDSEGPFEQREPL